MGGNGWEVFEGDDFTRGAANCGGLRAIEEIIAPIKYALNRNPLGFPLTTTKDVRLARTKLRFNGPDIVVSHSVWFRVDPSRKAVELLWVEVTKPDDMNWDEEDYTPF